MFLDYCDLPRQQRRAAQKLAQQLLRDVPPAKEESYSSHSIRGALLTAIWKQKPCRCICLS